MKFEAEHRPSYALGIARLGEGEAIVAETGAMVSMSSNVDVKSGMKGGLVKSALRSILGGESFFTNTFSASGGPAEVTLAPTLPGDIQVIDLDGQDLLVQSGSFLAGATTVEIDVKWGGAKSFFSSEGLFLLRVSGSGPVMISSYGAIHRVDLDGRSPYVVDTGHVVAFESSLDWSVRKVSGLFTSMLSGEGLVCEFAGRGALWMQTRSSQAFLAWLIPQLPTAKTGHGGT